MPKVRTIIDFEIIWKKMNLTLTNKEEKQLSQWLNERPEHQQYLDNAMRYYLKGSDFNDLKAETETAWKALKFNKIISPKRNSGWIMTTAAAAVVIFMIVIFVLPTEKKRKTPLNLGKAENIRPGTNKATLILNNGSAHYLSSKENLVLKEGGSVITSKGTNLQYTEKEKPGKAVIYNTLKIPRGGEFFLQLSDGTKVWLNSETELSYPISFFGKERKVELTGEAFFEVARSDKVPFIVESEGQVIKVLGTEFNVTAFKDNPDIISTLVKGSIEISMKNKPETKSTLEPNEQSSFIKAEGQITKHKVDPYQYVAWKEGRFVFEDRNLGEIMKTLSKWYDIDVVFANEDLKNIPFTGNLPRYSDFGEVIEKIQKTNEVEFIVENKQITIK